MITIAIHYRSLFLFKRRINSVVPTGWNELSEKQFMAISRIVNGADPDLRFMSVLTGIPEKLLKKLSPFTMLQLTENIDFITKAGNMHTAFIIKEIKYGNAKLIAPKPKLDSLTFGQFIFADAYYTRWMKARSEPADQPANTDTLLNNLIATLYLIEGHLFTSDTIETRSLEISGTDIDMRKAIGLNFGLVMVWLQKSYPLIFREPEPSDQPAVQGNSAWLNLFESMVADDLINRDRYAELPIHTVLRHLTRKYKENARH